MSLGISRPRRRIAIIVNYGCLLILFALFVLGKYGDWSIPVFVGLAVVFVLAIITFVVLHARTKLWRLIHSKAEKLDERQVELTRKSLQYAYGIFAVVCLLYMLVLSLLAGRHDSTLMLIFIILLYLAHTLPSSIIAWTEKRVD